MINKEKIFENVKLKISISNFDEEENIEMKKNNKNNIFKIATVACCMLVLTTGVVFAKDIIKYFFGDEVLDKAAESGYVGEINSNEIEEETTLVNNNTGNVINDIDVSVKFDEFIMDDYTLSTNMTLKFDEKINDEFELEKIQHLFIDNLIIIDNDKKILYSTASLVDFENICKEYGLNQQFSVWDENHYNCKGSMNFRGYDKETGTAKYTFGINPADKPFPKSKELTFIFNKIRLEKFEEYTGQNIEAGEYLKSNSITLTGNWNFKFEVPEKMYNRTRIEYKVTNVSNADFEVYEASVFDTGFSFGAIISNVEGNPFEYKTNKLRDDFETGKITLEEWQTKLKEIADSEEYKEYAKNVSEEEQVELLSRDYIKDWIYTEEELKKGKTTYLINSRGEKFNVSNLIYKEEFVDKDKLDYFTTFELTKVDATDKLKIQLIYNDEPVYIELEKVK